jgi:hypothetical protein
MKDRQAVEDELRRLALLIRDWPARPVTTERLRGAERALRWVSEDDWPPPSDMAEE